MQHLEDTKQNWEQWGEISEGDFFSFFLRQTSTELFKTRRALMSYILCPFWIFMLPAVNKPFVNMNRSTELQICAREDLLGAVSETLRPIQPAHNLHHLPPVYFWHIYVWSSVNPPVRRGRLRRKSVGINICAGYIVFAFRDVHVWTDKNMSMFTLEAFTAGAGDTVLPLRGRPQLCGHGGDIQDVFSLYMFRTLPRRNKRPSHRNFLCCSPTPPFGAGGGRVWVTLHHPQTFLLLFLRLVRPRALAVSGPQFVAFIAFVRAAPTAADSSLTGDAALTQHHTHENSLA